MSTERDLALCRAVRDTAQAWAKDPEGPHPELDDRYLAYIIAQVDASLAAQVSLGGEHKIGPNAEVGTDPRHSGHQSTVGRPAVGESSAAEPPSVDFSNTTLSDGRTTWIPEKQVAAMVREEQQRAAGLLRDSGMGWCNSPTCLIERCHAIQQYIAEADAQRGKGEK